MLQEEWAFVKQVYGGNLKKALVDSFPEMKSSIATANLENTFVSSWLDLNNRRDLFLRIAQRHGFNPLIPENWYGITHESVVDTKVALHSSVSQLYVKFMTGSQVNPFSIL
jgi:hypothetical protein